MVAAVDEDVRSGGQTVIEEVFPVPMGPTRYEIHEAPFIKQGIVVALASTRHTVHEMMGTRGPGHWELLGCGDCHCGGHG